MLSRENDRPRGLAARLQEILGLNDSKRSNEELTLWFRSFVNELEDAHASIRSRIDAVNAETSTELNAFQEKMRETVQTEETRAKAEISKSLKETVHGSIQELENAVDVSGKKIVTDFEQLARDKCAEAANVLSAFHDEIAVDVSKLRVEAADQISAVRQMLEAVRSEVGIEADRVRGEATSELESVAHGIEELRAGRVQFLADAKRLEDEGNRIVSEAQGNLNKFQESYGTQLDGLMKALNELSSFCASSVEAAKVRSEQRLSAIEKAVEDCASEEEGRILMLRQETQAAVKNLPNELKSADEAAKTLRQITDKAAQIQSPTLLADPHDENAPARPEDPASAAERESLLRTLQNEPWVVVNDEALGDVQVLVMEGVKQGKRLYCGSSVCRDNARCVHVLKVQEFLRKRLVEVEV